MFFLCFFLGLFNSIDPIPHNTNIFSTSQTAEAYPGHKPEFTHIVATAPADFSNTRRQATKNVGTRSANWGVNGGVDNCAVDATDAVGVAVQLADAVGVGASGVVPGDVDAGDCRIFRLLWTLLITFQVHLSRRPPSLQVTMTLFP